jgi:hypothetical protein
MKKVLVFILCLIFLASCANKYEKAISNCVQTLGDSKIDLKFKLKNVEEQQSILVKDSLDYWITNRADRLKHELNSTKESMKLYEKYIEKNETYENYKKRYEYLTSTPIEEIYPIYNTELIKYSGNPDSIIALKIKATYTINNPVLNNAKQERTDIFIVSPDGKTCYKKLKNE